MLQNFTLGSFAQGVSAGAGAFESIASATGTGSSATITFTSIPSTYQSLQIRMITQATSGGINNLRFNNDSSVNYVVHHLSGNGTTVSAYGSTGFDSLQVGYAVDSTTNTDTIGTTIIDIHNYASSTQNKTLRTFWGYDLNGSGVCRLASGLWLNTNAINRIDIIGPANFTTKTQIALYGIKGA